MSQVFVNLGYDKVYLLKFYAADNTNFYIIDNLSKDKHQDSAPHFVYTRAVYGLIFGNI